MMCLGLIPTMVSFDHPNRSTTRARDGSHRESVWDRRADEKQPRSGHAALPRGHSHPLSGRSPGSRLCASPRLPASRPWHHAERLAVHSGGSAPDLHRLPYSPRRGTRQNSVSACILPQRVARRSKASAMMSWRRLGRNGFTRHRLAVRRGLGQTTDLRVPVRMTARFSVHGPIYPPHAASRCLNVQ